MANSRIIDKYIVNKVKVRVVTNVDDFDKTLFSILGIIENSDELGVLLIDKNDKEHYIPYTSIVEIQNLGMAVCLNTKSRILQKS